MENAGNREQCIHGPTHSWEKNPRKMGKMKEPKTIRHKIKFRANI